MQREVRGGRQRRDVDLREQMDAVLAEKQLKVDSERHDGFCSCCCHILEDKKSCSFGGDWRSEHLGSLVSRPRCQAVPYLARTFAAQVSLKTGQSSCFWQNEVSISVRLGYTVKTSE